MKLFISILMIVGLGLAVNGHADTGQTYTKVKTLLQNDGAFGGCMALLDAMPANGVCGNAGAPGYVSFMCDGTGGTSKSGAAQRWDQAMLAWLLQKSVSVSITDARTTSEGYCYVYDIRMDR